MARHVRVYSTLICGYCIRAKALLKVRGIPFEEIDVTGDRATRAWLAQVTGQRTVPQIFIGDEPVGGSSELYALDRSGELKRRLAALGSAPQALHSSTRL
jgi:glutaredoxin 3